MKSIRIGTRKSRLALAQTELVRAAIKKACPGVDVEVVPMSTKGDRLLDRSLTSFGGKGVFTKELEAALLNGTIDLAEHSAKDLPMEFPKGLSLGAILEREDPRDVLVTLSGILAKDLPAGSVIGTSSLRREIQIRAINPQVRIKLLRGNVPTRLDKLAAGEYDGILLAAAGLKRLGLEKDPRFTFEYLDVKTFLPAAGQGILATQIREGELGELCPLIHSEEAAMALDAEREYLRLLGGSCNAPCGAYAWLEQDRMCMDAMFAADAVHPYYASVFVERGTDVPKRLAALAATAVQRENEKHGRRSEKAAPCSLQEPEKRTGFVSLVGAGPGDVGLVTEKGMDCIRRAQVLVYDALIPVALVNQASLDAELIYAGKRSSNHVMKQSEINLLLVQKAQEGKYVVRLKGGDPFIFGRGGEEAQALKSCGTSFEIVPGVSSAYSVPAYAGIPVTQRGVASSFHVITGHEGVGKGAPVLDYATLAKEEGTLVFLMGLGSLPAITSELIRCGKDRQTPAAVIQKGTTAQQRMVTGTLETIADAAFRAGLETPAISVIGDVVSLSKELSWFTAGTQTCSGQTELLKTDKRLPLSGKRVLLTGTRRMVEKQAEVFTALGAEAVPMSLIETVPCQGEAEHDLKTTLRNLEPYHWLVFTSQNGVEQFFRTVKELRLDYRKLLRVRFAVIGSGTKEALEHQGFHADFVPSRFSSEDLAKEWIPLLDKEERVLLLRAKEGSPVLPKKLSEAGISFLELAAYETWRDLRRREDLNRILPEIDYVTVASASAVRALAAMTEQAEAVSGKLISIGPETTKAANACGLLPAATAYEFTADGLAEQIIKLEGQATC